MDDNGLAFSGTANLPSWLGSTNGIVFSGEIPDADHYTFNVQLPSSLDLEGFLLTGATVGKITTPPGPQLTLTPAGIEISGQLNASVLGTVDLSGTISARLGLHSHQTTGKRDAGRLHARRDTVTLDPTGLGVSGQADLPGLAT